MLAVVRFLGCASPVVALMSRASHSMLMCVRLRIVMVGGITLFRVRGVSAFPAERRAREISAESSRLLRTVEAIPRGRHVGHCGVDGLAEVGTFGQPQQMGEACLGLEVEHAFSLVAALVHFVQGQANPCGG